MLRATGSTGRRKGPASFSFRKLRTVEMQNLYCEALRVAFRSLAGEGVAERSSLDELAVVGGG